MKNFLILILLIVGFSCFDKKEIVPTPDSPIVPDKAEDLSFYIQLQGELKDCSASYCFFDLVSISENKIETLKKENKKVICYFSAGTYEDWREDKILFPKEALGKENGWSGERWINPKDITVINIMKKRIDLAKSKKCSGVDFDNTDFYGNKTGFNTSEEDSFQYIKFLSDYAHSLDLLVSIKNTGKLSERLSIVGDMNLVEQCHQYGECSIYSPWIKLGKPVFNIEYKSSLCKPYSGIAVALANLELDGKMWKDCK